jgi:hypothetical protein
MASTTPVGAGPGAAASSNNVRFIEFAISYQEARKAAADWKAKLPPGQEAVIYRVSKGIHSADGKESVFLSRQFGNDPDGNEIHAPAIEGTDKLQYELYAAPSELLSTSSPSSPTKLAQAVDVSRKRDLPPSTTTILHGQLDPKPSGPNVIGPIPSPKSAQPTHGQLDPKPTGPNSKPNPPKN